MPPGVRKLSMLGLAREILPYVLSLGALLVAWGRADATRTSDFAQLQGEEKRLEQTLKEHMSAAQSAADRTTAKLDMLIRKFDVFAAQQCIFHHGQGCSAEATMRPISSANASHVEVPPDPFRIGGDD